MKLPNNNEEIIILLVIPNLKYLNIKLNIIYLKTSCNPITIYADLTLKGKLGVIFARHQSNYK